MKPIVHGTQIIFGRPEKSETPNLPDGWEAHYSSYEFAKATSPTGKRYWLGRDTVWPVIWNIAGDRIDTDNAIKIKDL